MIRRICSQFGMLVLLATLFSCPPLRAQSAGCADIASPSPVSAQKTKISITGVEFESGSPISDTLRAQLAKDIQEQEQWATPEESDSSWIDEAVSPVRDSLRNQGYFKAVVEGTPYLVRALAAEKLYVLRVTVDSGPKFMLGNIRFTTASGTPLVFSEALLRQQFQLQDGGLFDVSKIRDGLEAIGRLYGSKGYIDATPEPDTTIDEKDSRIDVLIKVDEQKPYRIAKIEFLGLGTKTRNELSAPQQVGDFFNPALWHTFFKANKPLLPPDSSPSRNMPVSRDTTNGIVDITLDFRSCPKTEARNL